MVKKTEQLVWVIYDISDDKVRRKVVKVTEEAGLYRVQKSVFLGTIERNPLDELVLQVSKLIDEDTDSVYIFPMCEADFKKVILKGQAVDKKLVSDEIKAMFF